jgi:hypothetical protein
MPDPIVLSWNAFATLKPPTVLFKIGGLYFDQVTTHFTVADSNNPMEVWSPTNRPPDPLSVQNGGTQAAFTSTPAIPLPNSGELCIGANLNGNITTTHSFSKPYVYSTSHASEQPKDHPTIIDFAPGYFTFGTKVALLLTGLSFRRNTVVIIREIYAPGVTWEEHEILLVDHETIAVTAMLTKTGEQIPGPGYLQVSVLENGSPEVSAMRRWVMYNLD